MNQYHRLSDAQFNSIATGTASPDAVAALKAGQVSKHIVMILTILDIAKEASPEIYEDLNEAYDVLQCAKRRAPEAVSALVGHPQVGIWAARCLRRLRGTGKETCPLAVEIGHLGAIAAVAGVLGGQRFTLTVPLREGTVLLPTVGLATFTVADPWAAASIRYDGLRIEISAGETTVEVPPDPSTDAPGWLGLRRIGSQVGHGTFVELIDIGPTREGAESSHLTRLSVEDLERWQKTFDSAWRILASHQPKRAASIRSGLVSVAVPEPGKPGGAGMSATMRDGFGHFIAAFNSSTLSFAETLVHEFQHSVLTALTDLAPLHDDASDLIYFAPWRQDPRHQEGLLQGTYAFLGITDYWRAERLTLSGHERELADFEFARWRHQIAEAADVLLGSGRLTTVGKRLVDQIRSTAIAWLDTKVPSAMQQLADRSVTDNRLCWRLANVHPDPGAISAIAESWLAGDDCPADVTMVESTTASDETARVFERFLLLRTRVSDPGEFEKLCSSMRARSAAGVGNASEADVAYVRDDYAHAVELYLSELAEDPGRPALDPVKQWAGLAMAASARPTGTSTEVLTRVPEVVAAVHRELATRDARPRSPLALASWMATSRVPLGA